MYENLLNYLGVDQLTAEGFVWAAIGVAVLGFFLVTYGRFIIIGCLATFCLVVYANRADNVGKPIHQVQHEETYLEQCISLTHNEEQCREIAEQNDDR